MIISKQDRKKLVSLLERYGYAKMSNFNVLNEAFESNILAILEKINSREHIGISGKQEQALSPVGAAFMKAFPIPWHLIKDDQISIIYDRDMISFMPNKDAETNLKNDINLPNNRSKRDYERINTANYVSNPLVYEQEPIRGLLKKVNEFLRNIKNEYIEAARYIGNDNPNSKNNAWIDSMKYVKTIYDTNKDGRALNFMILYATSRFLSSVLNSQHVTRDENEDSDRDTMFNEYVNLKRLESPYNVLNNEENNKIIETAFKLYNEYKKVNPDDNSVTRWGIRGELRTAHKDSLEANSLIDMIEPRVSDVLDSIVKDGIITKEDVADFYEKSVFNPIDNIEDTTSLRSAFLKYYKEKHKLEYEDEEGNFLKDAYDNKRRNITYGIINAFRNIKKGKEDKNSEVRKILGTLYTNGTPWKESSRASIGASIVESIQEWYSNKQNFDNYNLAIITDNSFRILYIFSCISFKEIGYGVNSKAIYGWKYGMEPKLENGDADITKTSKGVVYNYSKLNPEEIKTNNNVSCAILITVNPKDSKSEDLANFDSNIEKINADIREAIDKAEMPYEVSTNGKQLTINSSNKAVDNIFDLIKRTGVDYSEEKEDGKTIITFNGESPEDTTKLADLMNKLTLSRFYVSNGLKELFSNLKKRLTQKVYFEDIKSISPKEFGEFYDKQLRIKGEDKYRADEFNNPSNKVVNRIIDEYNKEGNKKSLYQIYIGNRTDSETQRIQFDMLFKQQKYKEIYQDINNAQNEINDIFSKILPSLKLNFKFDIQNVLGKNRRGEDVYDRGFDVISAEQIKRSSRIGNQKNNKYIKYSDPELVGKINSAYKYADEIYNLSITTAFSSKLKMTDVFKKIADEYPTAPFKKFDTLKNKVSAGLRTLAGDLQNKWNTSDDIDRIYKIINSMYDEYMDMMKRLDDILYKKFSNTEYDVAEAAKIVMGEIDKFYTKYNTYLPKY